MGVQEMLLGNHKSSRDWLRKAAKTNAATKTVRNSGVDGYIDETFTMKAANAEKGNDAAKFVLAMIYSDGVGVEKDEERAVRYKELARRVEVEIEEYDRFYKIITYRITQKDDNDNIIKKFELNNFQVNKF